MNSLGDFWSSLSQLWSSNALNTLAVGACALALATIPLAMAWMATQPWFQARRGRVTQRPSFSAAIVATLLTLSIPAVLLGIMIKSQYFDADRYEFDPNRIPSVMDQGRQFEARNLLESVYKADEEVRAEMERLAAERKALVEAVKKLDAALLPMSEAALTFAPTADALGGVVESVGTVRRAVGVDASERWQELVAILNDPARRLQMVQATPAQGVGTVAAASTARPALSLGKYESELGGVPPAQQNLARLLPLDQVPSGWEVGDLGKGHIETFNAENLYEKINGRAESFTQYDVVGMAYANFHPADDPDSGEIQLYIYEFPGSLNAFGKYGSEKPGGATTVPIGSEGYSAAGSVSFHASKYFVQVVSTSDDTKFAEFSDAIARAVAARIEGGNAAPAAAAPPTAEATAAVASDPTELFKLLPAEPGKNSPTYVAQDAFGYSFLSDVFLAAYKSGDATWQGFLRPYDTQEAASAVLDQYIESTKADSGTITELQIEGASRAVLTSNYGLFDVMFVKGNALAGVNGATASDPAVAFAREFAKAFPDRVPALPATKPKPSGGSEY